jgi:hypothetical protein
LKPESKNAFFLFRINALTFGKNTALCFLNFIKQNLFKNRKLQKFLDVQKRFFKAWLQNARQNF